MHHLSRDQQFCSGLKKHCFFCILLLFLFFIFEFENVRTCFVSMFHLFAISSIQCAPKGSAEPPTHKYLDTWLLHNLLIVLPASPSIILFQVEHAIAFQPVHLYYIYTLFTLNISEYVSLLSFLIPVCPHRLSRAIHQHIFSCLASAQLADCITCFTTNHFILV